MLDADLGQGVLAVWLQAHCYEVHGRFGHLLAPSVLARLQLAALYAACSSLLPEPASQLTGAQMAMELGGWDKIFHTSAWR